VRPKLGKENFDGSVKINERISAINAIKDGRFPYVQGSLLIKKNTKLIVLKINYFFRN
jgi:hypothetical protein